MHKSREVRTKVRDFSQEIVGLWGIQYWIPKYINHDFLRLRSTKDLGANDLTLISRRFRVYNDRD